MIFFLLKCTYILYCFLKARSSSSREQGRSEKYSTNTYGKRYSSKFVHVYNVYKTGIWGVCITCINENNLKTERIFSMCTNFSESFFCYLY